DAHREPRLARLSAAAPAHGPRFVADGVAALELSAPRPGRCGSGRGHEHLRIRQAVSRSVLDKHHLLRSRRGQPGRRDRSGRRSRQRPCSPKRKPPYEQVPDRLERRLRTDLRSTRGCVLRHESIAVRTRPAPPEFPDPWAPSIDKRVRRVAAPGVHTVAYVYEVPDTSTFRYRVFNMVEALGLEAQREPISAKCSTRAELPILERLIDEVRTLVIC